MKGIIAIDVETTGISPEKERIIEIGAFRPETGEVFLRDGTYVAPFTELRPDPLEVR